MTAADLRYEAHPEWAVPARHTVEVMALSLWLDGKHDEARAALGVFTGIGAAEFANRLGSFRDAVIDAGNAGMAVVWSFPTGRPVGMGIAEAWPCGHCERVVDAVRKHACETRPDPVKG